MGVHFTRRGQLAALRFEDGDDFLPLFKHTLQEHGIASAVILSGIGMLRDFSIGWLGPEGYEKRDVQDPHELLSLSGTVNLKPDGTVFIHPHVTLSDRETNARGGHLFTGTVNNTLEAVLLIPESMTFHRKPVAEGEPPRFCPE
ncbi:MAG: PPC domain-containing DNA-binding protein [Thermovirgaceae bacterium]